MRGVLGLRAINLSDNSNLQYGTRTIGGLADSVTVPGKSPIRIHNLDGEVIKTIYGPEYKDNVNKKDSYFAEIQKCGNILAFIYTGPDADKRYDKIILIDLDGKYLKTLVFDATIWGLAYHEKTGCLYMTTKGDPQIGYIELDKIQD